MNNGINITIFYYEIVAVVILILVYFGIDFLEKDKKKPFPKIVRWIPTILLTAIIVAHLVLRFFTPLTSVISGFSIMIYYYALIIISGAMLAAALASYESKRRGFDKDIIWDMLPWILVVGIIGARIWHVLTPSESILIDGKNPYFIRPLEMLNFRQGGLGIPGGILAGVFAIWIYCRKKNLNLFTWLDIIVPGVALAQGIGRWGNYFNQEIYGLPTRITTFPISVKIGDGYYLATFFYEFIWNVINMCLLLWLPRKLGNKMKHGDNFLVYLIFYGVGRFALEFIRFEYSPVLGKNINQIVSAVVVVLASIILIWRHATKGSKTVHSSDPSEAA